MKKDKTLWAQVLFVLTILAAMFLPSKGRAQVDTMYPILKANPEWHYSVPSRTSTHSFQISSGHSEALIRFSFKNDSLYSEYKNLDASVKTVTNEVAKILQWRLDEKQHIIDSLTSEILWQKTLLERERSLWQVNSHVESVNSYTDRDARWSTSKNWGIKKDTILVDVLCIKMIDKPELDALVVKNNGKNYVFPYVTAKKQERTLEWQTLSLPVPSRNGMTPAINATETKWVTTATRWLEDTSGCYQLVPLE